MSFNTNNTDPNFYNTLTLDRKRVSRNILVCEVDKDKMTYKITPFSELSFVASIVLCLYLLIKYTSIKGYYDEDINEFLIQVAITLSFLVFGVILHVSFVNRNLKTTPIDAQAIYAIIMGVGIGLMSLLFQGFIKGIKFSIVAGDYMVFFLAVAIAEEFFWRFGIQPMFRIIFNFRILKSRLKNVGDETIIEKKENISASKMISISLSVITTAFLFTLFHVFVYDSFIDRFIVFCMGIIFGLSFELTKRIDTSIIAHFVINAIAGTSLINQFFGGI